MVDNVSHEGRSKANERAVGRSVGRSAERSMFRRYHLDLGECTRYNVGVRVQEVFSCKEGMVGG